MLFNVKTAVASIFIFLLFNTHSYSFRLSNDMWLQPSIQPYEQPVVYPSRTVTTDGFRIKPKPREEIESIEKSPVKFTQESLNKGQKDFQTYCVVCHGPEGLGDGIIIKKGLGFYPVNLTTPGVKERTDGYIYAYIRYGGKVMMPSYRESILPTDAWNIVNYVRKLQSTTVTQK